MGGLVFAATSRPAETPDCDQSILKTLDCGNEEYQRYDNIFAAMFHVSNILTKSARFLSTGNIHRAAAAAEIFPSIP